MPEDKKETIVNEMQKNGEVQTLLNGLSNEDLKMLLHNTAFDQEIKNIHKDLINFLPPKLLAKKPDFLEKALDIAIEYQIAKMSYEYSPHPDTVERIKQIGHVRKLRANLDKMTGKNNAFFDLLENVPYEQLILIKSDKKNNTPIVLPMIDKEKVDDIITKREKLIEMIRQRLMEMVDENLMLTTKQLTKEEMVKKKMDEIVSSKPGFIVQRLFEEEAKTRAKPIADELKPALSQGRYIKNPKRTHTPSSSTSLIRNVAKKKKNQELERIQNQELERIQNLIQLEQELEKETPRNALIRALTNPTRVTEQPPPVKVQRKKYSHPLQPENVGSSGRPSRLSSSNIGQGTKLTQRNQKRRAPPVPSVPSRG